MFPADDMVGRLALRGPLLEDENGEILITFDASLSETHGREADITEHEVEEGVAIADHIRLRPIEVTVEAIVSATPLHDEWVEGREIDAWRVLRNAVGGQQLFVLLTGLDVYPDMAIMSLTERRQPDFAIRPVIVMRQIRKVIGQTVLLPEEVVAPPQRAGSTEQRNQGPQATETPPTLRQRRAARAAKSFLTGVPLSEIPL